MSPAPAQLGAISGPLTASFSAGHLQSGPRGLSGGAAGAAAEVKVNDEPITNPLITLKLNADDILTMRLPGGGGYHSPYTRDPFAVQHDVEEGFVSSEAAETDYGVVLSGSDRSVDVAATEALRRRLQER